DGTAVPLTTYDAHGNRPPVAAGGSQPLSLTFTLPSDDHHPTGDYYLIVVTDVGSAVTEADTAVTVASVGVHLLDQPLPAVARFRPRGPRIQDVSSLQVGFTKPISASTFTAGQVTVTSPAGTLDPGTFTVTALDDRTFRVSIPNQSAQGVYHVTLGTGITDL